MRHHMTVDGEIPFTEAEETARDTEEKNWSDGKAARNAQDEIARLESTISQRRIRAITTVAGAKWVDDVEKLIAIQRSKL